MVARAVHLDLDDVQNALKLGVSIAPTQLFAEVRVRSAAPAKPGESLYGAEQLTPRLDVEQANKNGVQNRQASDFQSLWSMPIAAIKRRTHLAMELSAP
jgi:hypothetical protein